MRTLKELVLGRRRVLIKEDERALHLYRGKIQGILMPGVHMLADKRDNLELEFHNFTQVRFNSPYETALFDKLPDVAAKHLSVVRTGHSEIAVVERDGHIETVLGPDSKLVVWSDAGPWTHQIIDVTKTAGVDPKLALRLILARKLDHVFAVTVGDGQAGMLTIDGVFKQALKSGTHAFWKAGHSYATTLVELKRQAMEVTGQELLTKDRLTIRINIMAEYQVTDPVKATNEVKNFENALYRALQNAFRKALGTMTLDQILEKKVAVDAKATARVKSDMAAIGIEVSDISLKDVILPGEMREILNKVVAAEKEAEANVIRRREETNATRSLLNTAKVMADNPVMLRLKELEALETISSKVESITIHNGTGGLLNDLVQLSDK